MKYVCMYRSKYVHHKLPSKLNRKKVELSANNLRTESCNLKTDILVDGKNMCKMTHTTIPYIAVILVRIMENFKTQGILTL